ncbi:hypothetical protein C8N46_101824 [Kordia periserrulae]|uniref:Uncharacterized protein n=1 Tax=Kordia periserrulae TaxID=701523 RepID=A0A2T6C7E1_9FLAO|nr:hypothetical protein [Kordia periserrulae]PTX64213.1 hypothetical protein C8N46_101824 [Kordia periserrulae]
MSETQEVCKEMTEEGFLTLIENDPKLKEKFEQLGISLDEKGLSVALNYYDFLSKEEFEFLKGYFKTFYPGSKDADLFLKFNSDPGSWTICVTNKMCDNCRKHLLNIRTHKDYLNKDKY